MGHSFWHMTPVTHHSADPWPAWSVTNHPVPDHGMSRSRLWWAQDYSLLFSAMMLQSGILYYGLFKGYFYRIYSKFIYKAIFTSWTRWTVLKFFFSLTPYTFTPYLIMGQVFYGTDPWPTWLILCTSVDPFDSWPMAMTGWPIVLWLNVSLTEKLSEEANRKWPMGNRMTFRPMTSRDPERWLSWPQHVWAHYLVSGCKIQTLLQWSNYRKCLLVCQMVTTDDVPGPWEDKVKASYL